jgi:hypothetical protein
LEILSLFVGIIGIVCVVYGVVFSDLYKKIDNKQDVTVCREIKAKIDADLLRGDKKFDEVMLEIRALSKSINELVAQFRLITHRLKELEEKLPQFERRNHGDHND